MTNREDFFEVMAAASASLVTPLDATEILNTLVRDCLAPLDAQAAAVLVIGDAGRLQLLSASTHRSAEVEMFQIQHSRGPCVEAISRAEHVEARGDELVDRWGEVGAAIIAAGFDSVDAYPLRWQGKVIGGLNVFRSEGEPLGRDETAAHAGARALADVVTLVLVRTLEIAPNELSARVMAVVDERSAIEQAKGALAYVKGISTDDAHLELVERAHRDKLTLIGAAHAVLAEQLSS